MITKTDRRKLKRVLKNRYTKDVLKELSDNKVFNKKGKPFSIGYISNVFNGIKEDSQIQDAILKVYENRKKKQSKKNVLKKEVLKK